MLRGLRVRGFGFRGLGFRVRLGRAHVLATVYEGFGG